MESPATNVNACCKADAMLDGVARDLNAVAFRKSSSTSGCVERIWGDFEGMFGQPASAFEGSNAMELVIPEDRPRLKQACASIRRAGDTATAAIRVRGAAGTEVPVVGHVWGAFAPDGSLEAIEGYVVPRGHSVEYDRVLRGVVHDLNNMLSVLTWAARRGAEMAAENGGLRDLFAGTLGMARAANELTNSLAHLGAPSESDPSLVDDEVRQIAPLLQCLLGSSVDFIMQLKAEGAAVALGASELQRIVLNLVSNAREAMPNGGMVGLRTSQHLSGGKRYVRFECADTGGGVSLDSLPDLMKNGVSSKRRGTGLGLGIVRDLVRSVGGGIEVIRRPEGGAAFSVMLPVVDESEGEPISMTRRAKR